MQWKSSIVVTTGDKLPIQYAVQLKKTEKFHQKNFRKKLEPLKYLNKFPKFKRWQI